ncbi:hypothetical protein EJB05_05363, partial [Eragrostis curvula]
MPNLVYKPLRRPTFYQPTKSSSLPADATKGRGAVDGNAGRWHRRRPLLGGGTGSATSTPAASLYQEINKIMECSISVVIPR